MAHLMSLGVLSLRAVTTSVILPGVTCLATSIVCELNSPARQNCKALRKLQASRGGSSLAPLFSWKGEYHAERGGLLDFRPFT